MYTLKCKSFYNEHLTYHDTDIPFNNQISIIIIKNLRYFENYFSNFQNVHCTACTQYTLFIIL